MKTFEFIGSDNNTYSFKLSTLNDPKISVVQFERIKRIAQLHQQSQKTELEAESQLNSVFKYTDLIWNFLAHDFARAYPEHWIIKEEFHPQKGLSEDGIIYFASFIGEYTDMVTLVNNIFNDRDIKPNSGEEAERKVSTSTNGKNQKRSNSTRKK